MKKLLSVLLAAIMMFAVTACGSEDETTEGQVGEVVELEFWHALSDENGDVLEELVQKFNDSREDINITPIYQGHYRELFEKLNGSAQAGGLPTLSMIYCNRLTAYVMNDMVEELDPYIFDEEIGIDENIWESIPVGLRDNGMWDDKHYSLPFNKGAYLMYYNVDALEEKGIEVPTTWEELEEAGRVLSEDGSKAIAFNKGVGIDFSFWVEQAGGHIYDESTDTVMIDTPETKKAYEFITGMVNDGIAQVAFEDEYINGPISREESFIGFASSSHLPNMKEACEETGVNWAVAELPKGEKQAALFSGTDITMFNTSSEAQKKAGWEFIKFWFEDEIGTEWGMRTGYLPLTSLVLESDEFTAFMEEDPSKKIATNQFPYAYQDPKVLNGYALHSNMQDAMEQILAGEKSIEEALADAQQNARNELDEARANFATE